MKTWLDDQPLPYLTYEDLYPKFVDKVTDMEHLKARITLRNEKGYKYGRLQVRIQHENAWTASGFSYA